MGAICLFLEILCAYIAFLDHASVSFVHQVVAFRFSFPRTTIFLVKKHGALHVLGTLLLQEHKCCCTSAPKRLSVLLVFSWWSV